MISIVRCAAILMGLAACHVATIGEPHVPPVGTSTTRIANSGIAGREYVQALYQCARDNLQVEANPRATHETAVAFEVRGGRFVNPHFTRASGSPEFDHAAFKAVMACDGRIATPSELRPQLASEGVELSFLNKRS